MANPNFDDTTLRRMKLFYQEEYAKALGRANELRKILEQMQGIDVSVSGDIQSLHSIHSSSPSIPQKVEESASKREKRKSSGGRRKKRGPKPVWPNFIMKRLKATQTPLSYDDMANHAIAIKNLNPGDFEKVRTSIVSAAFRLRNKEDKIDTHANKGSRTKYMGLKEWFEREGKLKSEFAQKI